MIGVLRRMSGVGSRQVLSTAVVGCAIVTLAGCENGGFNPVAPTSVDIPMSTAVSDTSVPGGDVRITELAAPTSYPMTGALGWSGSCTIGTGGSGFTFKGEGATVDSVFPDTVMLALTREGGFMLPNYASVNHQGAFKASPLRVETWSPGTRVYCRLLHTDGTVLAEGPWFQVPE